MPPGRLSDKVSGAPGFASLSRDRAFLLALKPQNKSAPQQSAGLFGETEVILFDKNKFLCYIVNLVRE